MSYYGALELFNSQFYVEESPSINGIYTVYLLKKLIKKSPCKIIIFGDSSSYHRGEEMQKFSAKLS